MSRPQRELALLALGVMMFPAFARAEVMDKVTPPWEPVLLLATGIMTAICALLARRPRWTSALLAVVLACAWAVLRLADDFHDPYVGPAIRAELSASAYETYRWLMPIQVVLPAVLPLCFILARRIRRARQQPERVF
jgi:hypothetical protein